MMVKAILIGCSDNRAREGESQELCGFDRKDSYMQPQAAHRDALAKLRRVAHLPSQPAILASSHQKAYAYMLPFSASL